MRTTKFAALFAAVALLVVGATFASFADWAQEADGWVYYDKNGDQVYDTWKQSGDGWYYLGGEGIMLTDELVDEGEGKIYYVDATGKMVTNTWIKVEDDDYADENDDEVNYRWFYFGSDGKAYKNAKKVCPTAAGDKTFIFNSDGEMVYGWAEKDEANGYQAANDYVDGTFYCGEAYDGAVVMGDWRELEINDDDDTAWFYFKATTGAKYAAKKGEGLVAKSIDGKTYAFDEEGCMKTEWSATTESGFYGDDGAKVVKGWFYTWPDGSDQEDEDDKNWYYAEKKGEIATKKVVSDGGKFYFVDKDGVLLSGLVLVQWEDATWKKIDAIVAVDDYAKEVVDSKVLDLDNVALYYCNEEHDGTFGCVLTGTHDVEDGDYTLNFEKKATMAKHNGAAYNRIVGNVVYTNGEKLTGDADENRYWFVEVEELLDANKGEKKLENTEIKFVDGLKTYQAYQIKDKDFSTAKFACMSASGTFVKSISGKKDTDDYKVTVEDWLVTGIK